MRELTDADRAWELLAVSAAPRERCLWPALRALSPGATGPDAETD
jgi:hypothetical protein